MPSLSPNLFRFKYTPALLDAKQLLAYQPRFKELYAARIIHFLVIQAFKYSLFLICVSHYNLEPLALNTNNLQILTSILSKFLSITLI